LHFGGDRIKNQPMQKITPFLTFDDQAEAAAKFYVSLFKDAKILDVMRYGKAGPGKPGDVMWVIFELEGQEFMALNGVPQFKFSPATSFFIKCKSQKKVDRLWEKLSAGGKKLHCGWVTDKFGVTWQVVPVILEEYLKDKNPNKSQRVMQAMMQMDKLDIKAFKKAYRQKN
jgi:predicted 3-demethylubiquinone-9 3-methyltransferase (glyoxalase superfamily)